MMKTAYELPDPLLRHAKAVAAEQDRPLRDLIAEATTDKLAAPPRDVPLRRSEPPAHEWEAYLATLERQPDGSDINPNGIDDKGFFETLASLRSGRLT